jgi:hypothetical protein
VRDLSCRPYSLHALCGALLSSLLSHAHLRKDVKADLSSNGVGKVEVSKLLLQQLNKLGPAAQHSKDTGARCDAQASLALSMPKQASQQHTSANDCM